MKREYAIQFRRYGHGDQVADTDAVAGGARDQTLAHFFAQSCENNLSKTSIIDRGKPLSYEWLLQQAWLIASRLRRHPEFSPGVHVGLLLSNSPEYVAAFYGTLLAGCVAVPVPMHGRQPQIDRLLNLARVRFVIQHAGSGTEGELIELNATSVVAQELAIVQETQLAVMLFTSGSSGSPKAVMLSHRNVLSNCRSILEYLPIRTSDRTLAIVPLSHALGNSVLQSHIASGATLVFDDQTMFPAALLNTLTRERCTNLTAVPEVLQSLNLAVRNSENGLPELRYLAVAGGQLEGAIARELAERIAPAELYLMYGQTEATARLAYLPPEQLSDHADTIGRSIPGVELSIRDEHGQPVNDGVTGTLHARGPNIMLGYFEDPAATAEVLVDGWLNTGDLARSTSSGQLQICGRANGLIKTQGYRFHPLEVENLLAESLPGMQLVATPVNFFGQTRVALFAKQRINQPVSAEQIQSICRRILPRHMMPQRVEIVENWPLSGSQKIDRRALQHDLEDRLGMKGTTEKSTVEKAGSISD